MFYIYDSRVKWIKPFLDACHKRGVEAKEIRSAGDAANGYALVFPHAHPGRLEEDRDIAIELSKKCNLITDINQVMMYENKRGQTRQWFRLMPETNIFTNLNDALAYLQEADFPLVSKADVGASSYNVRILKDIKDAESHITEVFATGVIVEHCDSLGTKSVQNDYVILQRFIPHYVTYRVNVIGRQRAIFYRYCYPDKQVAQTGNVKPCYELSEEDKSLLDYVEFILPHIGSKWVALDILKDGDTWKLLETSLRWPWPSPGDCMNGKFFPSGKKWADMWDVLLDEVEAGELH